MKTPTIKLPVDVPMHVATFLARVSHFETVSIPNAVLATKVVKGIITLILPPHWNEFSDACKRELLSHEVAHWAFGHHLRKLELLETKYGDVESKDAQHQHKLGQAAQKFNMVCDCALHHTQAEDLTIVTPELERVTGKPSIVPTYERLGLPPCPPEIAFEMLPDAPQSECSSCGSLANFEMDGSEESQGTVDLLSLESAMALPASMHSLKVGTQPGAGCTIPELPPIPKWIRQVLDLLWHRTVKTERDRSWRRHSRVSELLPGNTLSDGLSVRVMLDASGSVFTPELLGQFLSVLGNTPELMYSDVVVFDAECAPPLPIANKQAVLDTVKQKGGGTLIAKAGAMREAGRPVVWLTDGCSADGFPEAHSDLEVWVVPPAAPVPKGALVVRMEE